MKKLIILPILFLSFSCVMNYDYSEYPETTDYREIGEWISERVEAKNDEDIWGTHWLQSPDLTLEIGTGDCESICLLFLAILDYNGITAQKAWVEILSGAGAGETHALVLVDGLYIETTGSRIGLEINYKIELYAVTDFDRLLHLSHNCGRI